ncbi:MAG: alanine racemase [Oscillospiraceae bacterium]|jgi:alanine racemase|nr:alanine racemase [Oscillospiraceae bacterium]
MSDKLYGNAWQEVDLSAARYNIMKIRESVDVPIAAVVKADAYGHGIERMAELFYQEGAAVIATANQREALRLRRKFPDMPLWVMGALGSPPNPPNHPDKSADLSGTPVIWRGGLISEDLVEACVKNKIMLSVGSADEAEAVSRISHFETAYVQIKIDTGFHRLGIPACDAVRDIIRISRLPNIHVAGIFSHLTLSTKSADEKQDALFRNIYDELAEHGLRYPRGMADSIALYRYPEMRYDTARVGALLYGCKSRETPFEPMRVMRVCARIVSIREIEEGDICGYDETWRAARRTRIATLPIGYADGVPRRLRERGETALNGRRARYVGLPCMDQCMIDVTDIPAKIGDTVTLFGGNGADSISFEEYAAWLSTNRNECMCAMGRRVPRVYADGGEVVAVDDPLVRERSGVQCP